MTKIDHNQSTKRKKKRDKNNKTVEEDDHNQTNTKKKKKRDKHNRTIEEDDHKMHHHKKDDKHYLGKGGKVLHTKEEKEKKEERRHKKHKKKKERTVELDTDGVPRAQIAGPIYKHGKDDNISKEEKSESDKKKKAAESKSTTTDDKKTDEKPPSTEQKTDEKPPSTEQKTDEKEKEPAEKVIVNTVAAPAPNIIILNYGNNDGKPTDNAVPSAVPPIQEAKPAPEDNFAKQPAGPKAGAKDPAYQTLVGLNNDFMFGKDKKDEQKMEKVEPPKAFNSDNEYQNLDCLKYMSGNDKNAGSPNVDDHGPPPPLSPSSASNSSGNPSSSSASANSGTSNSGAKAFSPIIFCGSAPAPAGSMYVAPGSAEVGTSMYAGANAQGITSTGSGGKAFSPVVFGGKRSAPSSPKPGESQFMLPNTGGATGVSSTYFK